MIGLIPVYKLRVVYKSGYTHDFEVTHFSITNGDWEWAVNSVRNKPLKIGTGEIAAVWQIGCRRKLGFKKKA